MHHLCKRPVSRPHTSPALYETSPCQPLRDIAETPALMQSSSEGRYELMTKSQFIALEGIDGSGTTTQLTQIAEALTERGRVVTQTMEPSRGPIGTRIRDILRGEEKTPPDSLALLFAADRLDHLQREIVPALERGEAVLSDRYLISSLAYQSLHVELPFIEMINARARKPDLSILLKICPKEAAKRRATRGGDAEIFDDLDLQEKISQAYDKAFERNDLGPTAIVDASANISDVTTAILSAIDSLQ